MRLRGYITYIFLSISFLSYGQHSEIGILGGTSYYLGELNPSIQVANKLKPAVGVFFRRNTGKSKRYALRFGLNYGLLEASDKITSAEISDYRQLSFSSNLLEGYGVLEFNFLPYEINSTRASYYSPYVFIGIAGFMVNPEVENYVTNTSSSSGSLIAASIPFGFGVKFNLVNNLGMGIEWGMRKTFTDEIDGLPETYPGGYQLSNTQNNDWYSILGITLNYKILTKDARCTGVVN